MNDERDDSQATELLVPWRVADLQVEEEERDRETIDDIAASMGQSGPINSPTVRPDGTVITGRKRILACRRLGISWILVRVRNVTDAEAAHEVVIENLCRKSMTAWENCRLSRQWQELPPLSARGDASTTKPIPPGLSRSTFLERAAVYKNMSHDARKFLDEGNSDLSMTALKKLAKLPAGEQLRAASLLVSGEAASVEMTVEVPGDNASGRAPRRGSSVAPAGGRALAVRTSDRSAESAESEDDEDDEEEQVEDGDEDEKEVAVADCAADDGEEPTSSDGARWDLIEGDDSREFTAASSAMREAGERLHQLLKGWAVAPGRDVRHLDPFVRRALDLVARATDIIEMDCTPADECGDCDRNGAECFGCSGSGWISRRKVSERAPGLGSKNLSGQSEVS